MQTEQKILCQSGTDLSPVETGTVQLVVTSPPYPMIEMWDACFMEQDPEIKRELEQNQGWQAYEKMHRVLDRVWQECDRVLQTGGFICINIGDATRTIGSAFQMYPNHCRITQFFADRGYSVLPDLIWRKPTNSPNKFMGSGMYPAGAYVTYEHEHILILRKGGKRTFSGAARLNRQESAYFWEERNRWFSDLWEIRGEGQTLREEYGRNRSAAYPLEIPYRLVQMYSVYGDTVLDPFLGTGTTLLACALGGRNGIGVERVEELAQFSLRRLEHAAPEMNGWAAGRLERHRAFIRGLGDEERDRCYQNEFHGCPVKTKQEQRLRLRPVMGLERRGDSIIVQYQAGVTEL